MICLFSPLCLLSIVLHIKGGRRGRYRMVFRLKTTNAISAYHLSLSILNPAQDDVYSIQPYVIKFVSDLL